MKDLIKKNYSFIVTSMSFNDFHQGKDGQYNFNVRLEMSNSNSYLSTNHEQIKFDINVLMIGTVDNIHTGFILNASTQIIIELKKGIQKEKIEQLILTKNEENTKRIDETLRPIIVKEIEDFFKKTFYKGANLRKLS